MAMGELGSGLSVVHLPSVFLKGTPITLLMASFVPSALRFQSSDITSSHSHSKPNPELVSGIHSVHGICGDLLFLHSPTKWDQFLCRFLAMQSFERRLSVTTLLASGQDSSIMFHQPRQDRRFVAGWFLRAAPNVAVDGSDDSTYQHHCVLDEPLRFFVSFHCVLCGDFCSAHFSFARFLNVMLAGSVSLFSVILRYPSTSINFATQLSTVLRLHSSTQHS